MATRKPAESLTVSDLVQSPVWKFLNDDASGETLVRPVKRLPVRQLDGMLVGTQARLANGSHVWALVGNCDVFNPQLVEHFLTFSIEHMGEWFYVARYHDADAASHGPEALASFLGLSVDEVFPISIDLRSYVTDRPEVLAIQIPKEPRERLTRAQLIALAVP